MKKTIALTLAVILVLGLFGCASSNDPVGTTDNPMTTETTLGDPDRDRSDGTVATNAEASTETIENVTESTENATENATENTTEPTEDTEIPDDPGDIGSGGIADDPSQNRTEPPETQPAPTEPKPTEHKHEYSKTVTKPTCEKNGYTVYACACGEEYTDNHIPATGHDMIAETVIAPTTEAEGYTVYKCKNCSHTENRDQTEKLPAGTVPEDSPHEHAWGDWTCDATSSARTCSICNKKDILTGSNAYAVTEVLDIINQHRKENGIHDLTYNYNMQAFVNLRAEEISIAFEHKRLDGTKFNYAECIAIGYGSAESAVDGWMNSDAHRTILMREQYVSATVARYNNGWVIQLYRG